MSKAAARYREEGRDIGLVVSEILLCGPESGDRAAKQFALLVREGLGFFIQAFRLCSLAPPSDVISIGRLEAWHTLVGSAVVCEKDRRQSREAV